MRRAAAGDRLALERLYSAIANALYSYLCRLTGNPTDADDLLQTTFLNAWRSRHRFRGRGARPWLFTIARNAFLTDAGNRRDCREREHGVSVPPTPGEQFAATELARRLDSALGDLPPDTREAVILSRVSGLAIREIAGVLGTSEQNTRVRIHRGLKQLKEVLNA